jgi:hypothetical protein
MITVNMGDEDEIWLRYCPVRCRHSIALGAVKRCRINQDVLALISEHQAGMVDGHYVD